MSSLVLQTARFITDLDVFNEWMNEVDYEYDEEAAKGKAFIDDAIELTLCRC